MAFQDDVHAVAGSLPPSEIPNQSDVPALLASVVKVLEHAGVAVAEELLPKVADPLIEASAQVVGDEATVGLEDLVHKAENALEELRRFKAEHDTQPAAPAPPAEPVTPPAAPATEPAAPAEPPPADTPAP